MYVPQLGGDSVEAKVYDNMEDFFETGFTFKNSIDISTYNELGNYSIGLGSINQDGIVSSTGLDKYTAKFNGEFNCQNSKQRY